MEIKNIVNHATGESPIFWNFTAFKDLINTFSSCTNMVDDLDSSYTFEDLDNADENQAEQLGLRHFS